MWLIFAYCSEMVVSSLCNLGITFSLEALLPSCSLNMSVIALASLSYSSYSLFHGYALVLMYSSYVSLIPLGYGVLGLSVIACCTLSGIGIYSNADLALVLFNSPVCSFSKA